MRRARRTWRLLRRCAVFFLTIAVFPVVLVFLITSDQHFRQRPPQEFYNDTIDGEVPPQRRPVGFGAETLARVGARMEERGVTLREKCHQWGLNIPGNDSMHRPNPWEFLVNREHHLVWCNVFKAASTSWMYNFNLLAGYSAHFLRKSNMVPLSLARNKYPRPTLAQLKAAQNDSVTFLIVRHPLERLLSAYRDKLQFAIPHTVHQKLGTHIIMKYRRGSIKGKGRAANSPRWPTFPEFVRFLVDEARAGHDLDMHWTPIAQFCSPCMLHFDIIAKFETLQEDQQFLIHRAGLKKLIAPQWKNPGRGKTTSELATSYYAQLTREQILQLYDLYKYDFELFEYDLRGYLEVGITPPAPTSTTTEDILRLGK